MVRGSTLELMDHTFDGVEDSRTGDLRNGLGQLVDGRYGWDNFKAAGTNSHVKGIIFWLFGLPIFHWFALQDTIGWGGRSEATRLAST